MNFVLQPWQLLLAILAVGVHDQGPFTDEFANWQLLLAILAVGVPQVGGLPHRYTRVA